VAGLAGEQVFDGGGGAYCLQFPFVLVVGVPVGEAVDEPDAP
jgi:hypothetical protein